MNIVELKKMQVEMDEKHGFSVNYGNDQQKYELITKELVGLFGEIGEFSNLVKKLNLKLEHGGEYELDVERAEFQLEEELADSFIYMLRLSHIIGIDLEETLLKKMENNRKRYEKKQIK